MWPSRTHLYKRVGQSVSPSVHSLVRPLRLFKNRASQLFLATAISFTKMNKLNTCGESPDASESYWQNIPAYFISSVTWGYKTVSYVWAGTHTHTHKHTYTHRQTHTHTHSHTICFRVRNFAFFKISLTVKPMDLRTDGWTDRWTDKASCWVAIRN